MTRFSLCTLLSCMLFPLWSASPADAARQKYNFNADWLVKVADEKGAESPAHADSAWKKVSLPYAWNEDSAFKVSIEELPTGVAWYRKHFSLPPDSDGKKVFLEFEGVRQAAEVYLNGEWVGRSESGVMAFGFDVTDKLKPAPRENLLAVRTDNDWKYREKDSNSVFQWNDRNFNANYGGITKNVRLHITDPLHQTLPLYSNLGTTGVYIYAQDFDIAGKSARITAESQVKNESASAKTFRYKAAIADPSGKTIATLDGPETTLAPGETTTVRASGRVNGLNFWSWGYGYLYDVATSLEVDGKAADTVVTRTGFRKTAFDNGVLTLNGRVLHLKGYAQRSTNEWPAVGSAVPPWMSDFSNGLMVASNGNLVRWMHITPSKQDVESCDRVGLIQAMPAGDSEKDVTGRRWEQRIEVMRDAIIYNRNNPSILFYECGNNGISDEHMAEMKALRDKYDPHGGRAIGSRDMLGSSVAEYGGEMLYINKSARKPMWMMEYSRDEGLRKYWDEWTPPFHKNGDGPLHKGEPGLAYNHNQDSHAIEDVARWYDYWLERPGTGTRVNAGGVNIVFSDSNTHHRGAENYRRSGEVDAMRLPKDGFYAHQVMWNGWVDPAPGIHLVGHWNYAPGVKKPVYAVSTADTVELFVNGKSKGPGTKSHRFLFTWDDVAFEPGEIQAVGKDETGTKICETTLETAGKPAAIRLTPRTAPGGLKADGADMALIDVEVVDSKGRRCPTALNPIDFTLKGPAEWRGGIAQAPDNGILATRLPVEGGVNRVILRSTPQAGKIVLSASSPGLESARLELASQRSDTANGLSTTAPESGLPLHLDRGPAPAKDTVTPTRIPVRIVKATAGADAGAAGNTFDDNEATSWKNDGQRNTAWIEFELERPARVGELTMKLGGWRSKAYPIRIAVDGREVFSGTTPKTLGYVTLPVKPTHGKTVRIALVGAVDDKDAFGLVEVTGKKLADATASGNRGELEILEAEIYEPLPTATR